MNILRYFLFHQNKTDNLSLYLNNIKYQGFMKKYIFLAALLVGTAAMTNAQNTINSKPKLKEVVVYNQGAELTHTATATLAKGENEVMITGLSRSIMQSSLKVEASGGAVISSSELSTDYLTDVKSSARIKQLQDSIKLYNKKQKEVQNDIKLNKDMLSVLEKGVNHNVSGGKDAGNTEKVNQNLEYYKTKSKELNGNIMALTDKQEEINKTLSRMKSQLQQESNTKGPETTQLKLAVSAPMAGSITFTIRYYTTQAGWAPHHDVLVTAEDKPITITTKAQVRQYTGLDWDNVKISLSTGAPSTSYSIPEMDTWFLREIKPVTVGGANYRSGYVSLLRKNSAAKERTPARVQDEEAFMAEMEEEDAEPMPVVQMLFYVNGMEVDESTLAQISQSDIKTREMLSAEQTMDRFGRPTQQGAIVVTTKNMEDYVSSSEDMLNRTFNIDLRYSIPGNGKNQSITIMKNEIQATYNYFCVPKLDTKVYLVAETNQDLAKLNLLSGNANVSFGGSFVGTTYINVNADTKKLSFTLGEDKGIVCQRKKVKDYSSKKTLGSDIKVLSTYEITVKNNKSKKIAITVKDQYPISTNKKIDVELLEETTKATTSSESTGIMTWDYELGAGQSQKITLSYSVKYPKDMNLKLD